MELAERLARVAPMLAAPQSLLGTMEEAARLALEVVPGVDAAGLSVFDRRARNFVATDSFASACEALQFRLGEGPAVEPELGGEVVLVDLDDEPPRWPQLVARLRRMGVCALVACHLAGDRRSPARLNLYARNPLGPGARDVAALYAVHAAVAMTYAGRAEQLGIAMMTRERIGQAVGLLMHRHDLGAEHAFELLVRASQELNLKLRDLAEAVVEARVDRGWAADLARRAAKDGGARVDELRYWRTTSMPDGESANEADAEARARMAAARAVYRLGECAARASGPVDGQG